MPAIIRRQTNQVVTRASQPVAVTPGQTAAGALGAGIGAVGEMFDQFQDDVDAADAKAADADFAELIRTELYADTTGFMYSQGADSINRRGDVSKRIEEGQKRILSHLSPNARRHAESAITARFNRSLTNIDRHTSGQRLEYLDNAAAARITTATNEAIYDPAQVETALSINRQEILDMAARRGWSPEQTKLKLAESRSAVYGGIVERLAVADPVAALGFLRDHKDEMQGAVVAKLESALVPMVRERAGRQRGAAAAASWGRVPEGFDWSNHTAHGGKRPDAITGLDDTFEVGLANLINSAPADIKSGLQVFSGFRSDVRQDQLWKAALKKYGSASEARKWVAPPGSSQHNHGKAADLQWNGQRLDKAPEHVKRWVHENAAAFGLHFPLGNEPWHVEVAGTRGTAPFVPPPGGLESLLDIEDPDERDAAISEFNLIRGVQNAQREASRQAAQDAAFNLIEAGGNVNDLPVIHRQNIGVEGMSSLRSYQAKIASGEGVRTDDEVYVALSDMMATNPEAFMAADPMVWRDKLDDTDFQFFVKQRADMKAGLRTATGNAPNISTLRTASSVALEAAGIDKPEQINAFESELLRWSTAFTAENNQAPSPLDINNQVNQMLVPITINPAGAFNEQEGSAFEIDYDGAALDPSDDITPEDVRDGRLRINGSKVSNEIIESFANLFEARLGRAPEVRELIEGLVAEGLYE